MFLRNLHNLASWLHTNIPTKVFTFPNPSAPQILFHFQFLSMSGDKTKIDVVKSQWVNSKLSAHAGRHCYLRSPRIWWSPLPGCLYQLCRLQPHSWSAASWCRSQLAPVWMLPTEARPSAQSAHTPPASPCRSHRPTTGEHRHWKWKLNPTQDSPIRRTSEFFHLIHISYNFNNP